MILKNNIIVKLIDVVSNHETKSRFELLFFIVEKISLNVNKMQKSKLIKNNISTPISIFYSYPLSLEHNIANETYQPNQHELIKLA